MNNSFFLDISPLDISSMKLLYYVLIITAFMVLLIRRNKLPSRLRVFGLLLGSALTVQILDDVCQHKYHFMFHLYHIIEYSCVAWYLSRIFRKTKVAKAILYSIPVFIALLGLYFFIVPEDWNSEYMPEFVVMSLVLGAGTIYFFYELYTAEETVELLRLPDFWIAMGNLLFYSGTIMVIGMREYLRSVDSAVDLEFIPKILNLFLYSCYLIGLLCRTRNIPY